MSGKPVTAARREWGEAGKKALRILSEMVRIHRQAELRDHVMKVNAGNRRRQRRARHD